VKIPENRKPKNTQKTEKPKNSVEKGKAVEVPKRRDDAKEDFLHSNTDLIHLGGCDLSS